MPAAVRTLSWQFPWIGSNLTKVNSGSTLPFLSLTWQASLLFSSLQMTSKRPNANLLRVFTSDQGNILKTASALSARSHDPQLCDVVQDPLASLATPFFPCAGSERVKDTGHTGERLGESRAINSSLMTLRCCLENLLWNQKHKSARARQLPYRESKVSSVSSSPMVPTFLFFCTSLEC